MSVSLFYCLMQVLLFQRLSLEGSGKSRYGQRPVALSGVHAQFGGCDCYRFKKIFSIQRHADM